MTPATATFLAALLTYLGLAAALPLAALVLTHTTRLIRRTVRRTPEGEL